jgi:hypothetical protein
MMPCTGGRIAECAVRAGHALNDLLLADGGYASQEARKLRRALLLVALTAVALVLSIVRLIG